MSETIDELGPVDYIVVEFPGNKFNGEIAPALGDLVNRDLVRVLDLVFVTKDSDGGSVDDAIDRAVEAGLLRYNPRDQSLTFTHALRLPTFTVEGMTLIKRLTLIVRGGRIERVFYPVFPPDKHAEEVIAWLKQHPVNA